MYTKLIGSFMAYSDYGAFVYKNGKRRHDREDVCPYENGDQNLGAGARIYATLAKRIAELDGSRAMPDEIAEHPVLGKTFHAVLGDGHVRACFYKEGAEMCSIVYMNDNGAYDEIRGRELVAMALRERNGDGHTPYDFFIESLRKYDEALTALRSAGYDPWNLPDKSDVDEPVISKFIAARDEYYNAHSEWSHLVYGDYDYSIKWHGCSIRLIGVNNADSDALCFNVPRWTAIMIDENGDEWVCGYGSLYGAGWSDDSADDERYAEISGNTPPVIKIMNLISDEREVLSEDNEYVLGKQGYLYSGNGDLVYRGQLLHDDDEHDPIGWSSIGYGAGYVAPEDVITLLNIGIKLGREGINEVRCNESIQDYQNEWAAVRPFFSNHNDNNHVLHENQAFNMHNDAISMSDEWFDDKRETAILERENAIVPIWRRNETE